MSMPGLRAEASLFKTTRYFDAFPDEAVSQGRIVAALPRCSACDKICDKCLDCLDNRSLEKCPICKTCANCAPRGCGGIGGSKMPCLFQCGNNWVSCAADPKGRDCYGDFRNCQKECIWSPLPSGWKPWPGW